MNLRHLKVFLVVCETENMTRAAEALYMTQPSVSQVIADLEKENGVRLFERLNHRIYLTAAGKLLFSYASHILNLVDQAQKELSDMGTVGPIRIGASLTIGTHLLPEIINTFHKEIPRVEIFSQIDNTSVIEKMILEDQLDLGLVEGPVYSPYVSEEWICDDTLIIVCGSAHPLWGKNEIEISELVGMSFIIREKGSGTRDIFEQVMSAANVNWKISGVYNNTEAIKQGVRGNLGLAVVPKISVVEEIERNLVWEIKVKGLSLKRKFNLIYHKQKYFSIVMQKFILASKQTSTFVTQN